MSERNQNDNFAYVTVSVTGVSATDPGTVRIVLSPNISMQQVDHNCSGSGGAVYQCAATGPMTYTFRVTRPDVGVGTVTATVLADDDVVDADLTNNVAVAVVKAP